MLHTVSQELGPSEHLTPSIFDTLSIPEHTKHSGGILTLEELVIHHSKNPQTPWGYKWRQWDAQRVQISLLRPHSRDERIRDQSPDHLSPLWPSTLSTTTTSQHTLLQMQVCMKHTHMLNSYQQSQENKTDICSTKNEMHAGKKKKKRLNCRLKKTWWLCPEHVQAEEQWLQCARAAGVQNRNCLSHRKLSGPSICPVDNSTYPAIKAGQRVFNKLKLHLQWATCKREERCMLTPVAANKCFMASGPGLFLPKWPNS